MAAGPCSEAPTTSHTNTGKAASRTTVIRFGMVRTRFSSLARERSVPAEMDPTDRFYERPVQTAGPAGAPAVSPWEPMPRFAPFRGLRYDSATVPLAQAIAPPYDVIEPAERTRLATRSAFNSVHLELPEADLRAGFDRYQAAARLLDAWRHDGVLVPDTEPTFYLYAMTAEGRSTLGVIGALGLPEPDEQDQVLPHEETLPKVRSDRLELLRATRANLSPIWGLSLRAGLSALLQPRDDPQIDVFDDDGVRHQLWVAAPDQRATIAEAVESEPIVIADGHHRYETARTYQREVREAQGHAPGGHDWVMALIVELADDQLTVRPIHRVVSGLEDQARLLGAFAPWFDLVRAGDPDDRVVTALGEAGSLALVTSDGAWLLTPRPEAYQAAASDLDASVVALALESLAGAHVAHRHSWPEAVASLRNGDAQAAVLLRPPTVAQIARWARERRRMPPKTTLFSPKPRTGMVFRLLDS
jgi:uncharacterized protein (DUF1015 family)